MTEHKMRKGKRTPAARAASFSDSVKRWQRRKFSGPVSLSEMAERVGLRLHSSTQSQPEPNMVVEAGAERFPGGFDTDASFNSSNGATKVTVYSAFSRVPEGRALWLMKRSAPHRWAERSDFFKYSLPGEWDSYWREFAPTPPDQVGGEYRMLEHVEWHWTPERTGGIINVLQIGHKNVNAPELREDVLNNLITREEDTEEQREEAKARFVPLFGEHKGEATHSVCYTYELARCLQSRFLASWEPGGLSVDGGFSSLMWFPHKGDPENGLLCIVAEKELCYSRSADVIEDLSRFLNMMAPAVVSMLMEQLAYEIVLQLLQEGDPRASVPELPRDSRHQSVPLSPQG